MKRGTSLHRLQRIRDERGASAVEFALVAPLLFLVIFAIIDFGFGFHAWDATQNAAREGGRVAAVTSNPATIEARVRAASDFLDQTQMSVTVQCKPAGGSSFGGCPSSAAWTEGDLVRITVNYNYGYMTPLPTMVGMSSPMRLSSVAETRFEGN
jgi:Flp pilus assembly protein TadG